MTTLGERITSLRKEKGWSQFEAGRRMGVTKSKTAAESKIKRMELGQQEPSASEVVALAELFGCDMIWLLTGREATAPVNAPSMTSEDLLAAHPPEVRSYFKTVMDVVNSDNYVAKQILASATTAIRAVMGQVNREDEMLGILKDLQGRMVGSPPPDHLRLDENDGMSPGLPNSKPTKKKNKAA